MLMLIVSTALAAPQRRFRGRSRGRSSGANRPLKKLGAVTALAGAGLLGAGLLTNNAGVRDAGLAVGLAGVGKIGLSHLIGKK